MLLSSACVTETRLISTGSLDLTELLTLNNVVIVINTLFLLFVFRDTRATKAKTGWLRILSTNKELDMFASNLSLAKGLMDVLCDSISPAI